MLALLRIHLGNVPRHISHEHRTLLRSLRNVRSPNDLRRSYTGRQNALGTYLREVLLGLGPLPVAGTSNLLDLLREARNQRGEPLRNTISNIC